MSICGLNVTSQKLIFLRVFIPCYSVICHVMCHQLKANFKSKFSMTTKNKNNEMFDNKSVSLEHTIGWEKGT